MFFMQTLSDKLLTPFQYAVKKANELPDYLYLSKTIQELITEGRGGIKSGKTTRYKKEMQNINGIIIELIAYMWNKDNEPYFVSYMVWESKTNKAYQRVLVDNREDKKYKKREAKALFT